MPIPFLLIGIGAATGLIGVGKSIKAAVDISDAKDLNKEANVIIQRTKSKLTQAKNASRKSLENLGRTKLDILSGTVTDFVNEFSKIKNIDFRSSVGINEIQNFRLNENEVRELKHMGECATSIITGIGSGALGGALTAFGAYGAAGAFATASTGTAIATLSGAAATNATLAFFGGGSLAAGGLGMAGGTAVLGGLVAGPALAIMGFIVGSKAATELNKASENKANAEKFEAEASVAVEMCYAISKRSELFVDKLRQLESYAITKIREMKRTIAACGTNYNMFSAQQRENLAAATAVIKSIKSILDTPILTKDGNLTNESGNILKSISTKPSLTANKSDVYYSAQSNNVRITQEQFVAWVNKQMAPYVIGKGWISPVGRMNIVKMVLNGKFPSVKINYPDVYADGEYKSFDNYIANIWLANYVTLQYAFSNGATR